jgi:hypothetical protein
VGTRLTNGLAKVGTGVVCSRVHCGRGGRKQEWQFRERVFFV